MPAPERAEFDAEAFLAPYPILLRIAACESGRRQFDANGEVLAGRVNPADRGYMQINAHYHAEMATRLGFDIETLEGNVRYGVWLYEREGTSPWFWSRACWSDISE